MKPRAHPPSTHGAPHSYRRVASADFSQPAAPKPAARAAPHAGHGHSTGPPAPLTAAGLANYIPLHTFMETFAILVSIMIFGVAWNAYSGERIADLIAAQLRAERFRVIRAATAEEGLVRAVKSKPDLITLDNAVKFNREGGTVRVGAQRAAGTLEIAVADTGIGIAPADLPKLFQPLVQLDASLARKYGGIGLGLALAQRLAQQHGGTIEVSSEPDKGSTFTLRLPLPEEKT